MCGLLVGIREPDKLWLAPCSSDQLHADRQAVGSKASWHHDRRQARVGTQSAIGALLSLTDQIGLATDRRIGEGIEIVIRHHLEDGVPKHLAHVLMLEILISLTCFSR